MDRNEPNNLFAKPPEKVQELRSAFGALYDDVSGSSGHHPSGTRPPDGALEKEPQD